MDRGPIAVVLSAGRCGTQWLAGGVAALHPEVEVAHEPLGPLYRPRRYFRRWADPEAILAVPEVRRHLERIERLDHYVETGWPLFAAVPLLAARFPGRLRIVHLTRHPVPSALSHLAHGSYAGSPRDDAYTEHATLAPGDRNVFQPQYVEAWGRLSPYEKCLFWWTEVNLFALEAERRCPTIPFLRVRSEDVLGGDERALRALVAHLGLSWDARWLRRTRRRVDRWHHHTGRDFDPLLVADHPRCVRTAARLGYSLSELDPAALRARYSGAPDPGLDRIGRY